MSWRIAIRHTSTYHYEKEVSSSYNEARITPLSTPRQLCIEAKVEVSPAVRTYRYWDYWGTVVDAFDLHAPHMDLQIVGTSIVETATPEAPGLGVGWDTVRSADTTDHFAELLEATPYVGIDDGLRAVADGLAAGTRRPSEAALAMVDWVRGKLIYAPGATSVHTSAAEALEQGTGVCQDYAHLSLALLRAAGIPCRYVSGYLHPFPDAGIGQVIKGESHAWIEWWDGDWRPWDPTNGVPVGERHVLVGRGRDYRDVAPFKGIFHGGPARQLAVEVSLTRLG